tara:strand:+ start:266 stop:1318 length:1053 start_codon:yes stop_codon:yes gene_type:complete
MPASIFGERFYGRRTPAWHRLGVVMDEDATVSEAMEHIDVDFEITTIPATVTMPDGTVIVTNHNAIVREPTVDDNQYRVLSVVGSEWTPIQMRDLANYLDPISEKYPVETIGALGHGEKVFITLDAGESQIAGEDHKLYYLITDHRDGGGALQIAFTPVRVVCQNTLTTGLSSAKISVTLNHTKSIKADTQWYTNIFNSMLNAQDQVISELNTLAEFDLEKGDAEKVIVSAYPPASPPRRLKLSAGLTEDDIPRNVWLTMLNDTKADQEEYERRKNRVQVLRDGATECFEKFNDEFPDLANTPWAIYQAIVETEDYRKGKEDGSSDKSILYGSRAGIKAKAFNASLALCK